jgi:hypothetical protein
MDDIHIVWSGPRGSGKRTALQKTLQHVAYLRGLPFQTKKSFWTTKVSKDEVTEEKEDVEAPAQTEGIPYESSLVHMGFDIARMSMQDKNFIANILLRLGYGTDVAVGKKKSAVNRIIVFYHAHLLSHDSVLQLQMALELHQGSLCFWFTSELPLSFELQDWFLNIPVPGSDYTLRSIQNKYGSHHIDWKEFFTHLIHKWKGKPMTLERAVEIRDWVYYCLQRNLRWQEVNHYILDALLASDFPDSMLEDAFKVLAEQPCSGGGQTLPSYRIPIAWEHFGLSLAEALSSSKLE